MHANSHKSINVLIIKYLEECKADESVSRVKLCVVCFWGNVILFHVLQLLFPIRNTCCSCNFTKIKHKIKWQQTINMLNLTHRKATTFQNKEHLWGIEERDETLNEPHLQFNRISPLQTTIIINILNLCINWQMDSLFYCAVPCFSVRLWSHHMRTGSIHWLHVGLSSHAEHILVCPTSSALTVPQFHDVQSWATGAPSHSVSTQWQVSIRKHRAV